MHRKIKETLILIFLTNPIVVFAAQDLQWAPINKICISSIKNKYEKSQRDKYGKTSEIKISDLRFVQTINPGGHAYGNNISFFYLAGFERFENGQISSSDNVKIDCVVNFSGKVIGVEAE